MLRSFLTFLLGIVLTMGVGQVALAVDGPPVDQPMPADQATIVQPSESTGRVAVRSETATVQHVPTASKLPVSAIAAIDNAIPGGTIVDVDKDMPEKRWDAKVVDRQGQCTRATSTASGKFAHQKAIDKVKDHRCESAGQCAVLPQAAVPDAVIYDSENDRRQRQAGRQGGGAQQRPAVGSQTASWHWGDLKVESDKDDVAQD